jgi:hypothetical protein
MFNVFGHSFVLFMHEFAFLQKNNNNAHTHTDICFGFYNVKIIRVSTHIKMPSKGQHSNIPTFLQIPYSILNHVCLIFK